MRFLLPVLLAFLGLGAGVGAGIFLASPKTPETASTHSDDGHVSEQDEDVEKYEPDARREKASGTEFVDFKRQYVIPVIRDENVQSMVIATISAEITAGQAETFFAMEPRLRDAFLQVMFNHANMGGFDGAFTNSPRLDTLRRSLLRAGHEVVGDTLVSVLFSELARQDN